MRIFRKSHLNRNYVTLHDNIADNKLIMIVFFTFESRWQFWYYCNRLTKEYCVFACEKVRHKIAGRFCSDTDQTLLVEVSARQGGTCSCGGVSLGSNPIRRWRQQNQTAQPCFSFHTNSHQILWCHSPTKWYVYSSYFFRVHRFFLRWTVFLYCDVVIHTLGNKWHILWIKRSIKIFVLLTSDQLIHKLLQQNRFKLDFEMNFTD